MRCGHIKRLDCTMWFQYIPFSDSIKKRACRYLLQRYLGQFLEEKLTLDQLTVDLYNGTGSVSDVSLDVQALNELGEQQNLPIEFVDGYIEEVSVSIPWSSLLKDSSYVAVSGMVFTVQPKQRADSGASMLESVWSSMTSSMQMAAECIKQSAAEDKEAATMEGLELFAQTIDSILSRVKVKFVNTLFRLEHLPKGSSTGVAVEVRIKNVDYCDEAGVASEGAEASVTGSSAFSVNKFHFEGVSFYTDEFPAEARTFSRSLIIDNKSSDNSDEELESKTEPNPILLSKLGGRQEIRLKLKRGENVQGPKVDLELNLGSLTVFMTPRQLHLLTELAHGLAAPDTQDSSNVVRCSQKPMEQGDFDRVEQQLLHQLQPNSLKETRGLHGGQGWSTAPLEDSDEEFLPVRGVSGGGLSDSVFSDTSSLNASFSSTCSSYSKSTSCSLSGDANASSPTHSKSHKTKRKSHKMTVDGESGVEESRFHVRLSSLAILLLHDDILTVSPDTGQLTPASIQHMKSLADEFFTKLGFFAASGYGNKDFEAAKQMFLQACQLNHIRLLAAPVIMEGDEKCASNGKVLGAVLTAGSVELLECLIEKTAASAQPSVEYVELVKFMRNTARENSPIAISSQPDVRLQFKRTEKYSRNSQNRHSYVPHSDISISLQQCSIELDVSIVDRIATVLNPQPLCSHKKIKPHLAQSHQSVFSQAVDNSQQRDTKVDLKITSPFLNIKLRFPIPDLRPLHDMDRPPWWRRNIRKDILFVHCIDCKFYTSVDSRHTSRVFELQSKEILLLFQEGDTDTPIPFGRATSDEKVLHDGFGWPRIVVRINPKTLLGDLDEIRGQERPDPATMIHSIVIDAGEKEPSPFSSKKVVHESDTPHATECEGEELIIPGDKQEMAEFIDVASRNARVQIEVNLPFASIHFPSKHIYEVIYNRLNTDLSLWEASAPAPDSSPNNCPSAPSLSLLSPAFTMCKSAVHYEDSESESEEEGVFYSTLEGSKKQQKPGDPSGQSKVTATLNIGQGVLNVFTNVRDSTGNVIPEQRGEMQISLKELNLFTVTSYKGQPQYNYICMQANHVELHHCGLLREGSVYVRLNNLHGTPASHLEEVIYRTERGAIMHNGTPPVGTGSANSADMLTLAIRSQVDDRRVKKIRVACGIRGATLQHRVTSSSRSWFTQLLDFFDVFDYPVAGYEPLHIITELHQHLWDCAVDYRPIHLPLRCLLSVGSLSISSNLAARTSCSTLRFIAEDAFLFISDKMSPTVELRLDYVCVLDLGLFELSVRMSDSPRVDLRASNNVLHIRTCSDSARALAQLITYFASYGDLEETQPPNTNNKVARAEPTVDIQNNAINTLSESTVERVNILMEDAMIDDVKQTQTKTKSRSGRKPPGVEVFFFPDESVGLGQMNNEQVELSPSLEWTDSDTDTDSDFCIVEHEAGSATLPKGALPEVRPLTMSPVRVVDNHFSVPVGKADLLKAPKHFPAPVYRYTLREMTVVWHMYGGLDFKANPQPKKNVTINTESGSTPSSPAYKRQHHMYNAGVNYSKTCPQELDKLQNEYSQVNLNRRHISLDDTPPTTKRGERNNWQARGGIGRQHDVLMELQLNKVRFQHEVYPDTTAQASRQVLLIHEVEVRDRLATSQINKFLYQQSSEARPRQSHANMVVVKAVHLRPDPQLAVQECCLKVSLLPLRLNIDQDSLLFLFTFANEVSGVCEKEEDDALVPASPKHTPPVMGVETEKVITAPPPQPNLLIMLDDDNKNCDNNTVFNPTEDAQSSTPIFIRSFVFSPEVPIRLDYEGKRVDMSHGPLAGLLMGLAQLNCSELRLKRLSHRHGLLGFEKLMAYAISEWLSDIKKNQLPSLLGGVGPMYSLVQLFQGIRDLFWLPIEQYQRDGRIVRGLQRGANSFTTSTAMAALELTTRIVHAIQSVAETAFDMVSPGPSVRHRKHKKGSGRSRYNQPADIREGVTNAIMLVREGLGETAQTLVRVASAEHEQKGAVGAVGGVLRQIPPTVVAPIILASAATSNLLGGVRSQLVPDARREATLKWRSQDN